MHEHIYALPSPLICVPASLSGGAYQHIAAATEDETRAKQIFGPKVDPTIVVVDPELCFTTPNFLWLSASMRAIDHCVDTLYSLVSNAEANTKAEEGL